MPWAAGLLICCLYSPQCPIPVLWPMVLLWLPEGSMLLFAGPAVCNIMVTPQCELAA